jgi:hypothetical protein
MSAMMRRSRWSQYAAVAVGVALCSGCYATHQDGDVTVVTFSSIVLAAWTIASIVAIGVGLLLWRREEYEQRGVVLFGIGCLFVLVVVPGLYCDEVRIDSRGIHQSTGFWFHQTHKGFDFDEVAAIRVREIRKRRNTEEQWDLQLRSGGTRTIDPGDLWDHAAAEIVAALGARGIPIAAAP